MTLKDTIIYLCKRFPSLFPHRAAVLNQLFCVNGNGYEWENGQLIDKVMSNKKLKKYWDEEYKEHLKWERTRKKILKLTSEVDPNKGYKKFLEEKKQEGWVKRNAEKIATPGFYKRIPYNFKFYPVSQGFSAITELPKDIKPDWLEGAKETKELLIKYPETITKHGIKPEDIKIGEIYEN